jgi:site-specific DNA-methyltransferase (adenine-specific)
MARGIETTKTLALDYASTAAGRSRLVHADCFEWLGRVPANSIHAIVTDPPYGVKEYDFDQLKKRANGNGGIWRIPPSFDGHTRAPLPRFTALDAGERNRLRRFFVEWARVAKHALRPGGHVFIASNAFLSQLVYASLVEGGLEFRGQIIRMVRTLRGGDRPKNAEEEFSDVSSTRRNKIWVPIVVFVFHQTPAMLWESRAHKLTNNTAEVCRH